MNPKRESETVLWAVAEHPLAVECPRGVLAEIHASVIEGFRRLSRGGVEVGGVLFGRRQESLARIVTYRPIQCEHSRGPSFALSEPDRVGLARLLEAAEQDPQLQILEPLGWFVSHTRREVMLADSDLEVYNTFFAELWQVTLVLRPQKTGPTRAGFFVRENDGGLRTESSYREFTLEPPEPAQQSRPRMDTFGAPEPAEPEFLDDRPAVQNSDRGTSRPLRWVAIALASALLACVGLGFAWSRLSTPESAVEPLQLRLQDTDGQLRVEWNRKASAIRDADDALVRIVDGNPIDPVVLDREMLAKGAITYARRTEDVAVRLTINRKGQPPVEELARFLGPPLPKEPPPGLVEAQRTRDEALAEAERLRDELRLETIRGRSLQKEIERLESKAKKAR